MVSLVWERHKQAYAPETKDNIYSLWLHFKKWCGIWPQYLYNKMYILDTIC